MQEGFKISEKRFILDDSYLIDTESKDILAYGVSFDVVDLLNSLSKENKYLKTDVKELAEENERLQELQNKIAYFLVAKGLGTEFANFLRRDLE